MTEKTRFTQGIAYPRHWWWWIATWFGCGMSPRLCGTVGSLGALPFAYAIHIYWGNMGLLLASLFIFAIGIVASDAFLKHTGRTDDAREIVVDEVAGQWLILAALFPTWQSYLVGFVLFRAFDIVKPWPVSVADKRMEGGFGVMLDDMLAAIYPVFIYLLVLTVTMLTDSQQMIWPFITFIGGDYVQ